MPATSFTHTTCSLCEGPLQLVLPLAPTPPANEILSTYDPDKELFPLNLVKCNDCNHLQLDTEISMFRLFKHYVYTSNTSSSNLAYFHTYADQMTRKFHPKFIVDIGSNDGTFLHFFSKSKKLGVDPAENIVDIAIENGVVIGSVSSGWSKEDDIDVFSFDLAVLPQFRKRGVGTKLIAEAIRTFEFDREGRDKAMMRLWVVNPVLGYRWSK